MPYSCRGLMEVLCSIESNKPVVLFVNEEQYGVDGAIELEDCVELQVRLKHKEPE